MKTEIEAPPEWWAGAFARRQEKARVLILRHLRLTGVPMTARMLSSRMGQYEIPEVDHALFTLEGEGAIRPEERQEYSQPGRAWTRPVMVTYWALP